MAYTLTYTGIEIQDLLNKVDTIPDDIASTTTYFGTLLSSGWVGSYAPYSQTITVTGMASTDNAVTDVALTGTYATDQAILTDFALVYRMVSGTNQVTAYANAIPTVDIPLQFKIVR